MVKINQLRRYFWTIDPGYFHLKHAAKTIVAILISLWLVRDGEMLTKIIAGVASGSSMQVLITRSLMSRMVQVVILDVVYLSALALGIIVRDNPYWTAIALVVLGFVVNYVRRFGLNNSMAPMMAWILCFMATILPLTGVAQMPAFFHGAWIGFLVSAVVLIFIFPENYPRLFVNNSNRFFQGLAQGLLDMRRYVLVDNQPVSFEHLTFVSMKTTLDQLLESNQMIQQNAIFTREEKKISHILMHQYALVNAYSLMIDVYHSLWIYKHQLSRPGALALSHMSKEFSYLFSTTRVSDDYMVYHDGTPIFLPKLAEMLGKVSLSEPEIIMALLNFKLSFDLLNQHETQLLRGVNGA
jgi:hypothetical protein